MTASWAYLGGKYKEVSITWGDKTVVVSTTAPKTMMPQVEYAMNNLVNAMNAVEGTPLEKLYKEKFILNIDNREYSSCIYQDLFNANMVGAALFSFKEYNLCHTYGMGEFYTILHEGYSLTEDDPAWAFLSPVLYMYNFKFVGIDFPIEWLPLYSNIPKLVIMSDRAQQWYCGIYKGVIKGLSYEEAVKELVTMDDYLSPYLNCWLSLSMREFMRGTWNKRKDLKGIPAVARLLIVNNELTPYVLDNSVEEWLKEQPANTEYGYVLSYMYENGIAEEGVQEFASKYMECLSSWVPYRYKGLWGDSTPCFSKEYYGYFKFFLKNWNSIRSLPVSWIVSMYTKE